MNRTHIERGVRKGASLAFGLLALSLCWATPSSAAEPAPDHAIGTVFHDADGDGLRDPDEQGIAGVAVSNGLEIAVSDRDGRWRLPVTDDTILFVIKPRGWISPPDRDNHPRFYYIHRPAGSPAKAHPGVAPTGRLPGSVNFALVPHEESDRFAIALLADPQVATARQIDYVTRDLLEELAGEPVELGLTLGDNVDEDLSLLAPIKAAIGTTGFPWLYVCGNNDMNYDVADSDATDTFERVLGPATYAFDWGPVHFIVLEDLVWDPAAGDYHHGLMPEQIEFVRNDLALVPRETLVVIALHAQLDWVPEAPALLALFAGRPHVVAIAGHAHAQSHRFLGPEHGWPNPEPLHQAVVGAACGPVWRGLPSEFGIPSAVANDGTPNGYALMTFDGTRYAMEYRAAGRPADWQMTIDAPLSVRIEQAPETVVSANVFGGSERSVVEMRLRPGGAWEPMERVEARDPGLVRIVESQAAAPDGYLPLDQVAVCTHLWQARLPAGLTARSYRIEVRTTDMFGHRYSGSRVIRVE